MKKKRTSKHKSMAKADQEIETWLEKADLSKITTKPVVIDPKKRKGRPPIGQKVNLVLPEDLIERLRRAGTKRGIGYQTLARMILMDNVAEYDTTDNRG